MNAHEALPVFDELITVIERTGLQVEGLYRISGVKSHIASLMDELCNSQTTFESKSRQINESTSVHTLTAVLKLILRNLSPPAVPPTAYNGIVQAHKTGVSEFASAVGSLPSSHLALLKSLKLHLQNVADNSYHNKMSLQNLALMFGPNLMRSPQGQLGDLNDTSIQADIVNSILNAQPGSKLCDVLGINIKTSSPERLNRLKAYPQGRSSTSSLTSIPLTVNVDLEVAFDLLDTNKDGCLSHEEFNDFIRGQGYLVNSSQLKEIFMSTDKDHDGLVDCMQVQTISLPLLKKYKTKPADKKSVAAPFAFFDKGDTGVLSKDEFLFLLRNYGGNDEFAQDDAIRLVEDLKIEGDGLKYADINQILMPTLK